MRDSRGRFASGNSGRPKGAKNKAPNKRQLIKLLDKIVDDLNENFHKLTTYQQIKILSSFVKLYEDSDTGLTLEEVVRRGIRFEFGQYGQDDDQEGFEFE